MSQDKDKIIATLYEELKRKNKEIKKLKEENSILIRASLKTAEKLKKVQEKNT